MKKIIAMIIAATATLTLASCGENGNYKAPQNTDNAVTDTADTVKNGAKDAADKVGDAANDVVEGAGDAVKDATTGVENAVGKVTNN